MKLKLKINLYTAVMFLLLLAVINVAIYFTFSKMVYENELDRAYEETLKTVKGIKSNEEVEMKELLRAYLPVHGMFKVINQEKESLTTVTDPEQQYLKDINASFYTEEVKYIIEVNGTAHTFVSIPIIDDDGKVVNLQMMESLEGSKSVLSTLRIILIVVTALAMIPAFLSSQILSNVISRPILSMIKTMTNIQESGKHEQIDLPKKSRDELYQMGQTFNAMIDRLQKNYESQEQFVMNASHELRTPLTIIESYSDLLKRRGMDNPDLFKESIEAIHSEAVRMRELTEQLLMLAKQETHWKIEPELVDIGELTAEVVKYFHTAFDCDITSQLYSHVKIETDRKKLKQLLYIFIENACKYSEGAVRVETKSDEEKALIRVIDNGIGIAQEDLDKIFERFYRVDKARARKTGGFGLGLSLAKELAQILNLDIQVESEIGVGTTVNIAYLLPDSN